MAEALLMPDPLEGRLVIGISSRALFDLTEANLVYETQGLEAYRDYQRSRERDVLAPGTGFPLVRGLLDINMRKAGMVEVIVFSKNSADSAMRVFHSISAHGLAITRGVFRGGRDPWPFLPAFHCDLFLTAEPDQVLKARTKGVAAALVMPPPGAPAEQAGEVRIALDGDAVLFDDESERIFAREGIEAFRAHEMKNADVPMSPGPFREFLLGLARIQDSFPQGESPIRTALVTARDAPAHFRVVNTLRAWNVRVDETYFLGGVEKTEVLAAFGAHIFFDDQLKHAARAALSVPSAQVLWPPEELREVKVLVEPLAQVPAITEAGRVDPSAKRDRSGEHPDSVEPAVSASRPRRKRTADVPQT
jgi:5'-nucleotidase